MALSGGNAPLSWSMTICPRGGMLAQGAYGRAKPPLSLPQTSPSCLAPLFGALCPPEQIKGNAKPYSPPDPSDGQSAWWPWPWHGGPADRGGCRDESWLIMPRPGDASGLGLGPNPVAPDHRVVVVPGQGRARWFGVGPQCPLYLGSCFWGPSNRAVLSQSCLMG